MYFDSLNSGSQVRGLGCSGRAHAETPGIWGRGAAGAAGGTQLQISGARLQSSGSGTRVGHPVVVPQRASSTLPLSSTRQKAQDCW